MRALYIFMLCLAAAMMATTAAHAATSQGSSVPVAAAAPEASQGMVVTGDQEAPLVLYILPWQPLRPGTPPGVDLPLLLPKVLDSERSVLDEPLNRPEPAAFRPSR